MRGVCCRVTVMFSLLFANVGKHDMLRNTQWCLMIRTIIELLHHCTLCIMRYTLCIMRYTLCVTHYALHIMHYALHIMHYALHIMHYALHIMRYTLCVTHYTLCQCAICTMVSCSLLTCQPMRNNTAKCNMPANHLPYVVDELLLPVWGHKVVLFGYVIRL